MSFNKRIKYSAIALLLVSIMASSCKTKVTAGGTVYSKHHIPVEGATVKFNYSVGGKSQDQGAISTVSGKDGKFAFVKESTGHSNSSITSIDVYHSDSGIVHLDRSKFDLNSEIEIQLR